ncbi:H-NS histone family protein [Sabulicella rubraurantiaca]|uniref:H-NS histone family protein n=1 Tax=Sabulicella rubraurantiaca TaxID=2811429 RepID=UPI001A96C096|nr:H-NS histone family protein [Sabulicella rubraurantiaca]
MLVNEADSQSPSRAREHEAGSTQAVEKASAALETMSVGELRQVVSTAERLIQRKAEDEKKALKEEIERKAAALGISVRDLFGGASQESGRGRGKSARKADGEGPAPKFRGPNGELWSGRGRMPKWIQVAQAQGKAKDDFLIK